MATDPPPGGQILIYRDGALRLQVRLEGRTVWLSQRLIAELFRVSVKTVNEHVVNICNEGELDPEAIVRSFRMVQREGSRDGVRVVEHYSLEAILAVGYRIRSARGTTFRQWATARLSELPVKDFTLEDERIGDRRTEPHRVDVPGLPRRPSAPQEAHAHDRLGGEARRFPTVQ